MRNKYRKISKFYKRFFYNKKIGYQFNFFHINNFKGFILYIHINFLFYIYFFKKIKLNENKFLFIFHIFKILFETNLKVINIL